MLSGLLLLTVGGMFAVLAMCPIAKIAWQFVRLIALIAVVICINLAAWSLHGKVWQAGGEAVVACCLVIFCGVVAVVILGLSPLLGSGRPSAVRVIRTLSLVGGLCALFAGMLQLDAAQTVRAAPRLAIAAGQLLSAYYLGSVTVAWLLGHRYLTATAMTIEPLTRASRLLLLAVGARWVFLLLILAVAIGLPTVRGGRSGLAAHMWADWLMVSLRIFVGLVLPSFFAVMAWQCVKLRSTQSATGILFFMSVFVVIGELSSQYLTGKLGIPF